MRDTLNAARHTRAAVAIAALALFALPAIAHAEPREIAARVVWAHGDRAYLASSDSTVFATGLLVTLTEHGHVRASGDLVQVVDVHLAVVRLTSGSLERVKKLDRLRVLAERPAVSPMPLLRVGYPSGARASLAFACPGITPSFTLAAQAYRTEPAGADAFRSVRISPPGGTPAPDTLLVRLYGESADEEIALERGELDVAVFWPGELSTRMREQPRWGGALLGLRSHGVIAAAELRGASANGDARLGSLNTEMFSGDLLPWPESGTAPDPTGTATSVPRDSATRAPANAATRYSVDPLLPGSQALERFVQRGAAPSASGSAPELRLTLLDAPLAARDSLASVWRAAGVTPLYALRCLVVCAPSARALVQTLGPDAFANAPVCTAPERRP